MPTQQVRILSSELVAAQADRLDEARRSGRSLGPLRHVLPGATVADAYAIQENNTVRWLKAGRVAVGAKIGLTSAAVQRQLGVDQPDYGILFADMAVNDGEVVAPGQLMQPRVEAEIAFVMARAPDVARLTAGELINAVDHMLPALEIVDSRITDWDIGIVDTVADNASSGLFVLGTTPVRLGRADLRLCGMVLERNGEPSSFGAGAACLGNPLSALGWLARRMAEVGRPLGAGDVVLSGALGPMLPAAPGDGFEARIEGIGSVRVQFGRDEVGT